MQGPEKGTVKGDYVGPIRAGKLQQSKTVSILSKWLKEIPVG